MKHAAHRTARLPHLWLQATAVPSASHPDPCTTHTHGMHAESCEGGCRSTGAPHFAQVPGVCAQQVSICWWVGSRRACLSQAALIHRMLVCACRSMAPRRPTRTHSAAHLLASSTHSQKHFHHMQWSGEVHSRQQPPEHCLASGIILFCMHTQGGSLPALPTCACST